MLKVLKIRQGGTNLDSLRPDEKGSGRITTPGGPQRVNIITESGLYKLIMRSDKPQAKHFQDWVTRVVLPTIRKEGAYVAGEEHIGKGTEEDDEAIILRAMKIMERKIEKLKEERERARLERDRAIEDKDAMKESVGTYMHTVRDYVKMLDPRINLGMVARTLVDLGYYRSPSVNCYRVRRGAKADLAPIVTIKADRVVANSRDVAAYFKKEHRNVLRDIDGIAERLPQFASLNFEPWEEAHPTVAGRTIRVFDMTRDGFTFLAIGFTVSACSQTSRRSREMTTSSLFL